MDGTAKQVQRATALLRVPAYAYAWGNKLVVHSVPELHHRERSKSIRLWCALSKTPEETGGIGGQEFRALGKAYAEALHVPILEMTPGLKSAAPWRLVLKGALPSILIWLLVTGTIWAVICANAYLPYRNCRAWPTTEGAITESTLRKDLEPPEARVAFDYSARGNAYHSRHVIPSLPFPRGRSNVSPSLVTDYPLGRKVMVYYDPHHPDRSCLEPGPGGLPGALFHPMLIITAVRL